MLTIAAADSEKESEHPIHCSRGRTHSHPNTSTQIIMLMSIISFIAKWSVGVSIMACDVMFDTTVSILALLETIVIELFSIICVLVIDVWKTNDVELDSTPTRVNDVIADESKENDNTAPRIRTNTASTIESIDTNQTTESGSGSDDLRERYRHLQQESMKKKRKSRTQSIEIVGSQVVF